MTRALNGKRLRAALACAMRIGQRAELKGRTVVTVLPDSAERYISTVLFEGFRDQ